MTKLDKHLTKKKRRKNTRKKRRKKWMDVVVAVRSFIFLRRLQMFFFCSDISCRVFVSQLSLSLSCLFVRVPVKWAHEFRNEKLKKKNRSDKKKKKKHCKRRHDKIKQLNQQKFVDNLHQSNGGDAVETCS